MTTQITSQLKFAVETKLSRLRQKNGWIVNNGAKRDRLEIFADILFFCTRQRIKTKIMFEINLNYTQLQSYLKYLTRQGLLSHEENMYVTTEKGFRFLELFTELQGTLWDGNA